MVVLATCLSAESSARVWYVTPDGTGDAPTIQAAIDAASAGDDVLVTPGYYAWSTQGGDSAAPNGPTMLTMRSGVAVRSQGGPYVTTIDAESKGRVVRFELTTDVLLEGFTILGGNAAHTGPPGPHSKGAGGAILCRYSSSVEIVDNIVRENDSRFGGGGIAILDSQVLMHSNVVALNGSAGGTGGVSVSGGGAAATLERNTIAENSGGGVFCFGSTATISQNLILNNLSTPQLLGYGVQCVNANVTLSCNNAWGNPDGDFACEGGTGNISTDPLACLGSDDYQLQSSSPCLPENNSCGVQIGARGECTTTSVGNGGGLGTGPSVWASPNPFKEQTRITYLLRSTVEPVRIAVYDARGRRVARLVDGRGSRTTDSVSWSGMDERGTPVATGVYIVRLDMGSHATSVKLILAK
jgi:hypothetical protein